MERLKCDVFQEIVIKPKIQVHFLQTTVEMFL